MPPPLKFIRVSAKHRTQYINVTVKSILQPEPMARAPGLGLKVVAILVNMLQVDALHHFADQAAAISDFARTLKPGGRIVVEEFDARRRTVRVIALAERLIGMQSRFLRPQVIRDMMRAGGLTPHIENGPRLTAWIVGDKP